MFMKNNFSMKKKCDDNFSREGNTSSSAGQAVNSALFVTSSKYFSELLKQNDFCQRECFSKDLPSLNCSNFLSEMSRNPNQCIKSTLYIPMVIVSCKQSLGTPQAFPKFRKLSICP